MPKNQYILNPKSLEYEVVEYNWKDNLYVILKYFVSVLVTSAILLYSLSYFYDTPKERKLKTDISDVFLNYKMLNNKISSCVTTVQDLEQRDHNIYKLIFSNTSNKENLEDSSQIIIKDSNVPKLVIQTKKGIYNLQKRLYILSKSYDITMELAQNKTKMLRSQPAIYPIPFENFNRISDGFGYRMHPIKGYRKFHSGIDFSAPIGALIYSTADGYVKLVKTSRLGYGKHLIIDHGYGLVTLYGHCSEILVKQGDNIKRGQVIAKVGNTGASTGPHVHYEIRKNNKAINPKNYFFKDLTNSDDYINLSDISSIIDPSIETK